MFTQGGYDHPPLDITAVAIMSDGGDVFVALTIRASNPPIPFPNPGLSPNPGPSPGFSPGPNPSLGSNPGSNSGPNQTGREKNHEIDLGTGLVSNPPPRSLVDQGCYGGKRILIASHPGARPILEKVFVVVPRKGDEEDD